MFEKNDSITVLTAKLLSDYNDDIIAKLNK